MEEYLRLYVNHHQDDWLDWFPLCEFAANNAVSDTMQVSPFFANLGRDPRLSFDLEGPSENTGPEKARAQEAIQNLKKIHKLVKAEMAAAHHRHAEGYDKSRRPALLFRPRERVWLDSRHIKTT